MKKQPMILVSACLAGIACRYDGNPNTYNPAVELVREGRAIPFCPEIVGGLPTPRTPCEIQGDRIMDRDGIDQTDAFVRGAEEGLRIAKLVGCREALLKANSPSCGCGRVYDGTFSGSIVDGDGMFARLLMDNGITVRTDEDGDK